MLLKRHNQAKIIIYILAPDMSIICQHVHRLELCIFLKLYVGYLREIRTKFNFENIFFLLLDDF